MTESVLELAGFTDIVKNKDGTYNAVKDGEKFFGLYLTNVKDNIDDDAVEVTDVILKHDNGII